MAQARAGVGLRTLFQPAALLPDTWSPCWGQAGWPAVQGSSLGSGLWDMLWAESCVVGWQILSQASPWGEGRCPLHGTFADTIGPGAESVRLLSKGWICLRNHC